MNKFLNILHIKLFNNKVSCIKSENRLQYGKNNHNNDDEE
jgi:hypothetical protein